MRLQGCAIGCRWCDTRYTWDAAGGREAELESLLGELEGLGPRDLLVITGGEPLEAPGFADLLFAAADRWERVEVETAGRRPPPFRRPNVFWNWSPKLRSATALWEQTWAHAAAWGAEARAIAKIVVAAGDEEEAAGRGRSLPPGMVWLMPEGGTAEALHAQGLRVAEICRREGWRMSPRLHVWLWGARRGV